jgi:hypothetical protein
MSFERNAVSLRPKTDPLKLPVEWTEELPISIVVRQEQSPDHPAQQVLSEDNFADESEYDSLFRATQDRLDHINLSIARINPFYGIRRAPRESRVLPTPPIRCALTVDGPAPDARPASSR